MTPTDFEKLFNTYYMQVYSFAMTLVKNAADAEEITQQTFFKALSHKDKYRREAGEFTWLCSIAKNLAADEYRRRSKRGMYPEEDIASSSDIQADAEKKDTALRIHMILHDLKEPYKEVFGLRVFGELSYAEIGGIFGKTDVWARVTYHRAKLMIRERIDEDEHKRKI